MAYLSLFPLNLVAYPGEALNLHIFEPRYRQLANECIDQHTTFGIPAFVDNRLPGYGTEMEVLELVKRYDDGKMDIRLRGLRVFRIVDFDNPVPGKLYAGGTVHRYPEPPDAPEVAPELENLIRQLYGLLKSTVSFNKEKPQPYSYQIAHGVGLPIEGEYELLTIEFEFERQNFLIDHLKKVIPIIENMEQTKDRIRMNGHFKEFGPLNL